MCVLISAWVFTPMSVYKLCHPKTTNYSLETINKWCFDRALIRYKLSMVQLSKYMGTEVFCSFLVGKLIHLLTYLLHDLHETLKYSILR